MNQSSAWDLSTVAHVGRAIAAAAHNPQELAEVAFLETARLISTDFFQLGLFEGEQYRTLIRVQDGNRVENQSFTLDPENENIVSWVRRQGQPLLVHDFKQELDQLPAQPSYEAEDPPVSGLFLPLRVANSTVGLLAIQSRKPDAFSDDHVQLLSIISHSLAASLANLNYRQEAEFHTLHMVLIQEISRLLMSLDPLTDRIQQVVRLLAEVLDFSGVDVYERLEDQLSLHTSSNTESGVGAGTALPEFVQRCAADAQIQVSSP
ncbi:MAG: GAF domain-containing protein, partial [Anaerolineales bacterium]